MSAAVFFSDGEQEQGFSSFGRGFFWDFLLRLFDKAEIKLLSFKLHMIQQWLPQCDCLFVPSRTFCIFFDPGFVEANEATVRMHVRSVTLRVHECVI